MMADCHAYGWPGNIRQLENIVQATVVLGTEVPARRTLSPVCDEQQIADTVIDPSAAAVEETEGAEMDRGAHSLKQVSRGAAPEAEGTLIARMLERTLGNRKQAALNLGISYKALLYKAKQHGLEVP
jgi:DNA-binding NtrC family response regulator